jgi:hypothetical protein
VITQSVTQKAGGLPVIPPPRIVLEICGEIVNPCGTAIPLPINWVRISRKNHDGPGYSSAELSEKLVCEEQLDEAPQGEEQHKVNVQLNMASYIPMFCAGVPLPMSSEVSRRYLYRSKMLEGFITLYSGHQHPILKWQSIPIN